MLRKLLKHEFRATARVMLPLYLLLLCLAGFTRVMLEIMSRSEHWLVESLGGVSIFLLVVGVIAAAVMSLVIMVNRFHTNLMGPQGYLMMTLPASTHSLILSKALTALVWFAATAAACVLAVMLAVFTGDMLAELGDIFRELGQEFVAMEAVSRRRLVTLLLELLLLAVLGMGAFCLQVYASIATGHSFNKHKALLSFAVFFGISILLQVLGTSALLAGLEEEVYIYSSNDAFRLAQTAILWSIAEELVLGGAFYALTWVMMKKRLNLQ